MGTAVQRNMGGNPGSGMTAGVMLAGAVCVLALPSAVLAFTTRFIPETAPEQHARAINTFDPNGPGLKLARAFPLQSLARGQLYPFTPAKNPNRPDRSVTVAVRLDPQAIKAIIVRGNRAAIEDKGAALGIASPGFNLGLARGYHNFAQDVTPPLSAHRVEPPDLSHYALAANPAARSDSPFSPRIVIDEKIPTGRAPRTFAGDKEDLVDVGGSYRVTRNFNVTAGVRYSQDRERLQPLTDGRQDSQAVYVGTQIRF